MRENKKFFMIDEPFECMVCHKQVAKLNYSARDHCPYCLCSIHVDNNPGDRANECHGILKPIGIDKYKDTYKIVYQCSKCGTVKRNILAKDDDFDKVIAIMKDVK